MSESVKDAFIVIAILILLVIFIALIVMSDAIVPYETKEEDETKY